jgi:DNA-binding winged helix-turn-helix (wHTH) protein
MPDVVAIDPDRYPSNSGGTTPTDDPPSSPARILIVEGHMELWRMLANCLDELNIRTFPTPEREDVSEPNEIGTVTSDGNRSKGVFRFQGWELDLRTRRLVNHEGDQVPLTKGDYALLVAFLAAPGRPLSRESLLQATRVHENALNRSIDVRVLRLRRKLETEPGAPRAIRTERSVGYSFALPVERL